MRSRAFLRGLPACWALLLVLGWLVLLPTRAQAQQLSLQLDGDEVYAGLPFVLTVAARGFDESPQPTLSKLTIPGCKVTSLGVTPNVSSMVQIVNGQRSEFRNVTFAYRFRIETTQAGQYTVPPLTAEQGGKKATSPPARFSVKSVDDTKEMQLRLLLPERPLWVGETVDATLEWYLRRDVGQRTFSVPLLEQDEWVEIEAPPGQPRLGGFQAGSRQLELPYTQDKANLDGSEFARFRFQFRLTPTKVGTLSLPPARIVAALNVGFGRDVFGFQVPESRLFQTATRPLKLEIRPLPQAGRPASFKNAVGSAFNLEVAAGRTVVRVGDPIELRILLRGKGRLAGLILPELPAMGLSEQQFAAPEEPPAGEVLEDGKGKLFRVSVRLRSTDAKEIPALSFGYFDPSQGSYQTVHSQPIALSVKGSAVVGAGEVVGSGPATPAATVPTSQGPSPGKAQSASDASLPLVGADLALSDERQTWRQAASLRGMMPFVLTLYAATVALVLTYILRRRGQASRQRDAEARRLLRLLQAELTAATRDAARDAAPRLCTALRNLRRELALPADEGSRLLERLETETYSADAASRPLAAGLRSEVDELARSWMKKGPAQPKTPPAGPGAAAGLAILAVFVGLYPIISRAQDAAALSKLKQARSSYQAALGQSDRDRRRSGFAEAEGMLRELCQAHPDRPELLADWGNAALLAQEPGRALLAYRRALRLDPSLGRARRNLSFLREHLPDWLPRPRLGGTADSLLFWAQLWPAPQRHGFLAVAVLLATALVLPWPWPWPWSGSPRRRRMLRLLALVPALGGLAMGLSLALERDPGRDAVLMVSGATLRSADSLGAPPAVGHALPAGTEVTVDEVRGDWTRVTLADGQNGWLPSSGIESI